MKRRRNDEEESSWPNIDYKIDVGAVGQLVEYEKPKKLKKRKYPFGFALKKEEDEQAPSK